MRSKKEDTFIVPAGGHFYLALTTFLLFLSVVSHFFLETKHGVSIDTGAVHAVCF